MLIAARVGVVTLVLTLAYIRAAGGRRT